MVNAPMTIEISCEEYRDRAGYCHDFALRNGEGWLTLIGEDGQARMLVSVGGVPCEDDAPSICDCAQMHCNLRDVQTRCTELLEERRALARALASVLEFLDHHHPTHTDECARCRAVEAARRALGL